jgi:hypothetical protein
MQASNTAVQLALIKQLRNPTPYSNDPHATSRGYYGSAPSPILASLAESFPLQPLMFTLFCIERLLGIAEAGAITRKFAPRSILAAVVAMALMA